MKNLGTKAALLATLGLAATSVSAAKEGTKSFYTELKDRKVQGEVRIPMLSNYSGFAPHFFGSLEGQYTRQMLHVPLLDSDPKTNELIPYLAERWEVSEDKKTYTFYINKAAKWSDGTDITSADIKRYFDITMDPKTKDSDMPAYYDGFKFKVIDKHTVQFHSEKPFFNSLLSLGGLTFALHKYYDGKDFNKAKLEINVPTSGAYTIETYKPNQHLIIKRNQNWWGFKALEKGNVFYKAEKYVFPIIESQDLQYEKLIGGQIDTTRVSPMTWGIKIQDASGKKGSDNAKFEVVMPEVPKPGKDAVYPKDMKLNSTKKKLVALRAFDKNAKSYDYVGWNQKHPLDNKKPHPLFADKDIRRAMTQLMPFDEIMKKAYFGLAEQGVSGFGIYSPNTDQSLRQKGNLLTFNKRKAISILRKAGWKDSNKDGVLDKKIDGKLVNFEFNLIYNHGNIRRQTVAKLFSKELRKVGIKANVKSVEWQKFIQTITEERKFDAFILGWGGGQVDSDPKQIWHSKSYGPASNYVGFNNAKADALIDKANATFDLEKRRPIMRELSKVIYEDQPYTFLGAWNSTLFVVNSKLIPVETKQGQKKLFFAYDEQPWGSYSKTPLAK